MSNDKAEMQTTIPVVVAKLIKKRPHHFISLLRKLFRKHKNAYPEVNSSTATMATNETIKCILKMKKIL